MNTELKSCIMDAFDPAMETFIKSPEYQELNHKTDTLFSELRSLLPEEHQKKLNVLMNARDNAQAALAAEAYYRGVVNGIALQTDIR